MTRCLIFVLCALTLQAQSLEIAPTFNSGAMVSCGSVKVLLDTVFLGIDGYQRPSAGDVENMKLARPPYDGPLLLLFTHNHPDHFHSETVASLLAANSRARLVATLQIAGPLSARFPNQVHVVRQGEAWSGQGIEVRFLPLQHSGARWASLENTGHLVSLCGQTVFHPGDADLVDANFARALAHQPAIDTALVPAWYLAYRDGQRIVEQHLRAKRYFALHGDLTDLSWMPLVRRNYPSAVIPGYFVHHGSKP
jgi:L-ascorbate metabolism protein UlaG (beta-lactamase superfamily)